MFEDPEHAPGVLLFNVWEVKPVKSTQRRAASAAGLFALVMSGAPAVLAAQLQRGGPPAPDTPRILVATFRSSDPKLGVQAGDEVRKRVASENSAKDLWVISKQDVNNTLEASGYRPDSALSVNDLMELGKQVRADEVVEGVASKAGNGVRLDARLMLRRNTTNLIQPLPPATGGDPGDAAKQVEHSLADALKSLPAYKACENDLRAQKYDAAIVDGRNAIKAYPSSTLGRLCILSAYSYSKAPVDSIISISDEILKIDSTNVLALNNAADAYNQKGDHDKAIQYNLRIYRADPTNTGMAQSIVQQLAQSGAPDKALPIVDELLKDNPGDPQMLHTRWLLLLNAKRYKEAIAAGDSLVKADTAQATSEFFQRQIGAAQADSNAAAMQELAARGAQKFPNDANFQLILAQNYRKAGQLQQALAAATRATQLDPKNTNAWLLKLYTLNDLKQPDSVMVAGKAAIAAGVDKDALGQALLSTAVPALQKAQQTKDRADWESALSAMQTVDQVAPSQQGKFYLGVAAFSVALDALNNVQKYSKANENAKACSEVKVVEDNFATAQIAMAGGGSFDKATAGQIMGGIQQYSAYIPQFKKALKCK